MVKKYIKAVFNVLNKINKKTFLFAFFAVIFCFFTSLISFQNTEEVKISIQVAEAEEEEEEEEEDPCAGGCGGCSCSCSGSSTRTHGGYKQKRTCSDNTYCECTTCKGGCSWNAWYYLEWCGDNARQGCETCDGTSVAAPSCVDGAGYDGLNLCQRCDWQYTTADAIDCSANVPYVSYACTNCSWEAACTPIDWCGDDIKNGPEECDSYDSPPTEAGNGCPIPNYDYPAGLPNDGFSDTEPYKGFYLCDKCDWTSYADRDGDPSDTQICAPRADCVTTPFCIGTGTYLWDDDSTYTGTGTCLWDTGLECTPIDWCGDGKINGPEQFCDIHDATGTVDFGGQTCASKICSDIDTTDDEDKSSYSKNPDCLAEMAAYGGDLTCVNTCRHIYTVPDCDFPLNANGLDLSDDGQYVFVTDSSLWSLQMFPVSTPASSAVNTERLIAIHYFDSEPLSVDIRGDYAYVGTKGEFSIVNINQLNQLDAFKDPGDEYASLPHIFPPFKSKNPPLPFLEEQVIPLVATISTLGEVNDVHIYGNYAYLAIGTTGAVGPAAFEIIRISDPTTPVSIGSYIHPNTINGVRSVDVELSGTYAYVSYDDGSAGTGYFEYFDISDKTNPILKKSIDIGNSTNGIDISGNYTYIDGLSTLNSVDIANPGNPLTVFAVDNVNVGPSSPPNETFALDIDDTGNIVYLSVENIGLRAVDISSPDNISEDRNFAAPGDAPVITDVVINGFEICDNPDLGGETCVTQGFTEGDLSCVRFCDAFDTSGCVTIVSAACEGVICNTPNLCEIGSGICKIIDGGPVCVYPKDPDACITPGFCQKGTGRCEVVGGIKTCFYPDDPILCDLDGDVCTGDRCVSPDGGLTSECLPGSNICGGIVPCGRMVNDPNTSWDDTDECNFCHGVIVLDQTMDFLLKIASAIAMLALIITGFLFITSAGNPEKMNNAKTTLKWVIVGFLIIFLSWLIVDFFLSAFGYLDPIGGEWNVVCD
jgi:hypothetical protein